MGISIERNNFVSLQLMWKSIVDAMVSGGFEVELAADATGGVLNISSAGTSYSDSTVLYVLKPTTDVDALADTQPWRIVIRIENISDEVANSYSVNVVTPTQIMYVPGSSFAIAAPDEDKEQGLLNVDGDSTDYNRSFFHREPGSSTWSCFPSETNVEAVPLSYRISVSDHGIVLFTWAEAQDRAGDCFNWFCIQRAVDSDGVVLVDGHAPLWCVFSQDGGGGSNLDTVDAEGIRKFVVREDDVNAPTESVSAVVPTADSSPIINPIQQVAISESNKYMLNFPQGINTQRYAYPHQLDMICYTSADVISQYSEPSLLIYGETQPRTYKAMNANFKDNKGMRMLMLIVGSGISAT